MTLLIEVDVIDGCTTLLQRHRSVRAVVKSVKEDLKLPLKSYGRMDDVVQAVPQDIWTLIVDVTQFKLARTQFPNFFLLRFQTNVSVESKQESDEREKKEKLFDGDKLSETMDIYDLGRQLSSFERMLYFFTAPIVVFTYNCVSDRQTVNMVTDEIRKKPSWFQSKVHQSVHAVIQRPEKFEEREFEKRMSRIRRKKLKDRRMN